MKDEVKAQLDKQIEAIKARIEATDYYDVQIEASTKGNMQKRVEMIKFIHDTAMKCGFTDTQAFEVAMAFTHHMLTAGAIQLPATKEEGVDNHYG